MKVSLLKFTENPEKVCAAAAKLCYSVTGVDEILEEFTEEKIKKLLINVISSGHHSVLEHVSFTFGVECVSRALLIQLTRHRMASFSVQSQRYVKFKNGIEFVTPETIKKNYNVLKKYNDFLLNVKKLYEEFLDADIPIEDVRYVLPNATTTKIVMTMNARELRHFFSLRACNRAQWEIRDMACCMLNLVKKEAPLLFCDAGPNCVRGVCRETFKCDSPWERCSLT
ncbi:MAG: FAD-dependent thymidylate synthase [Endomicrobium sp.]|jgi:thymidylate synthase (FAD)|nr:FAD-dependent thymidylate synthase [Endomicrobium sp.]